MFRVARLASISTKALIKKATVSSMPVMPMAFRPFSSKVASDLLQKVEHEINYEKDNELENTEIPLQDFRNQKLPENLTTFLGKTGYKIEEKLGKGLISLTKESAEESIKISFDVEQVYAQESNEPEFDDSSDKEEFEESNENFFTLQIEIKRGGVTCNFDVDLYESDFSINSISFPEGEDSFRGPDINNLDEELTQKFIDFLGERHVGTGMYDFLWEYSTAKEYSEYRNWLQKWKNFLSK